MSQVHLSVVIPAYNEEHRILPYLQAVSSFLHEYGKPSEVIVVNDGSSDGTSRVVRQFQNQEPFIRLLELERNGGKGLAVRQGMRDAKGTLCLFADADGSTPIQEVLRFEAALEKGADLVVGSRALAAQDPQFTLKTRWHRTTLGNLFNWCVQRLSVPGIHDTQCGFKMFRKEVAQDLFSVAQISGFGFDLELLFVAQQRNYRITELPVNWSERSGSKVQVLRDGIGMFRELFTIRKNHSLGLYKKIVP